MKRPFFKSYTGCPGTNDLLTCEASLRLQVQLRGSRRGTSQAGKCQRHAGVGGNSSATELSGAKELLKDHLVA